MVSVSDVVAIGFSSDFKAVVQLPIFNPFQFPIFEAAVSWSFRNLHNSKTSRLQLC